MRESDNELVGSKSRFCKLHGEIRFLVDRMRMIKGLINLKLHYASSFSSKRRE